MELDFSKKEDFEIINIEIHHAEEVHKMYICKPVISKHPKILSEIENNVWKISDYSPDVIRAFLFDLYELHIHFMNFKLLKSETYLELYKISIKYDVSPLISHYKNKLLKLDLTPNVFNFLIEHKFDDQISEMYLNMDYNKITFELTKLFSSDIWNKIMRSYRLNSLELFYNYVVKFRIPGEKLCNLLNIYYKTSSIYVEDLVWITNCNEEFNRPGIHDIRKYLLQRMTRMDLFPKNILDHNQNKRQKII